LSAGEDDDSKIIEKLVSIQERIENGFTKINKKIAALKYELKGSIKSVREELNEVTKSLNAAWGEVSSLQEKKQNSTTATSQHHRRECEVKGGF